MKLKIQTQGRISNILTTLGISTASILFIPIIICLFIIGLFFGFFFWGTVFYIINIIVMPLLNYNKLSYWQCFGIGTIFAMLLIIFNKK